MNAYEKIITQMRKQGSHGNEKGVTLAKMISEDSCRIGELTLEREDMLIAQHLLTGYTDAHGNSVGALKAGDTVLVKRLSSKQYAVLERVI